MREPSAKHPPVQVIDMGRTYSARAFEPGCPKCGAPKAWADASGTVHHRCRSIVSEKLLVAECVPGAHHG